MNKYRFAYTRNDILHALQAILTDANKTGRTVLPPEEYEAGVTALVDAAAFLDKLYKALPAVDDPGAGSDDLDDDRDGVEADLHDDHGGVAAAPADDHGEDGADLCDDAHH